MNLIEKIKSIIARVDKQEFLKYFRLIGIIFSSLMVGLSVFYLITDYFDWFIYVPFFIFGIIFIILFRRRNEKAEVRVKKPLFSNIKRKVVDVKHKKEDKKFQKLLGKIKEKEREKDKEFEF